MVGSATLLLKFEILLHWWRPIKDSIGRCKGKGRYSLGLISCCSVKLTAGSLIIFPYHIFLTPNTSFIDKYAFYIYEVFIPNVQLWVCWRECTTLIFSRSRMLNFRIETNLGLQCLHAYLIMYILYTYILHCLILKSMPAGLQYLLTGSLSTANSKKMYVLIF